MLLEHRSAGWLIATAMAIVSAGTPRVRSSFGSGSVSGHPVCLIRHTTGLCSLISSVCIHVKQITSIIPASHKRSLVPAKLDATVNNSLRAGEDVRDLHLQVTQDLATVLNAASPKAAWNKRIPHRAMEFISAALSDRTRPPQCASRWKLCRL